MVSTPKIARVGELCEHVRKMGKYLVLVEQTLKVLEGKIHSPSLSPDLGQGAVTQRCGRAAANLARRGKGPGSMRPEEGR